MTLRFLSSNQYKIKEVTDIFSKEDITIIPVSKKIDELQTEETDKLVSDKLLKAFSKIGRPIFVEHTGLYLNYLNGFPGGLTQVFWDSLNADLFANVVGNFPDASVVAKTIIGYCDGMKNHFFEGSINGTISKDVRGNTSFQWDCVFIPEGYDLTFAELGEKKNEISMRKQALNNFLQFLKSK